MFILPFVVPTHMLRFRGGGIWGESPRRRAARAPMQRGLEEEPIVNSCERESHVDSLRVSAYPAGLAQITLGLFVCLFVLDFFYLFLYTVSDGERQMTFPDFWFGGRARRPRPRSAGPPGQNV